MALIQAKYQLRLSRDDKWHMDRPHFHEDVEILLSLSDGGDFFIENELYPLHCGTLLLVGEATLHKSIANDAYKRYVMHLPPSALQSFSTSQTDFLASIRQAGHCTRLDQEQTQELVELFEQLAAPENSRLGSDIERVILLMRFLLQVFTSFETIGREEGMFSPEFARVAPILEYIQQHITEPLTLDMISSRFFINKYHLCHIFKSATGFSVIEYIIQCRVLKARELLRQGMRVQEVGEAVGFRNNEHFIRTFGTLTGTSPKRYAKEYLAGDRC